jgi:FkbM family methyltransferase
MLTKFAETVFNAYLAELRKGNAGCERRRKRLRKVRKLLLKLGDPDIFARLDGYLFRTPFSSDIILLHFQWPLYDSVMPRLARAVNSARGGLMMLDVGANVGAATYLVSQEVIGRFLCIEANPRFKASLTHNLAQIPSSRARFVALTDKSLRLAVRHNYIGGNSTIETAPGGGEMLEYVTLDEALESEVDFRAPNLVKIDTEGYELKILRGASRTLAKHRPPLFFEYFPTLIRREGGDPDALFDLLRQYGYAHFLFYDGGGNLLTSLTGGLADPIQSLRRFCELQRTFFDVAAFHASDSEWSHEFERCEKDFFERTLHSRSAQSPP